MARLLIVALLLSFCFGQVEGLNLAYKKPTWQSSEKYSSDNAVDGFINRTAVSNQCAISEASPIDITWMVDLEAIQSIIYIIIHYRTEDEPFANSIYASRFLGFSVYVSNTTNKDDGQLCYHESNQTNIFEIMKLTCEVQGRYVIYYNTRRGNEHKKPGFSSMAYVELCEVQVIGCPLGFYSMDCAKPCPHGCRHCSFLYGTCLGGCNPGFEGHHCDIYRRSE
ncbi:uncharacterized protein LOC128169353 [Crassostrea angulata]|uniref:uncharacterized protein LOC128169353 n=1 Tax=Magallana angulata TaxID=2784310 RepID=UPI0022B1430C|nr:uncharacterized protein LOC128169353 [Crassostrea angulata]